MKQGQEIVELIYGSATNGELFLDMVESLNNKIELSSGSHSARSLLTHLKQSSEISQQFFESQQQQVLYNSLADQLPFSIILLDEDSQVIFANESALALLNIASVKQLPKIWALGSGAQQSQIKKQVKTLANHQEHDTHAMLLETSTANMASTESLLAVLSPIAQAKGVYTGHIPTSAVAALFISQQPDAAIQHEQLQSLYKLTPSEAFIAGKLASGYSTEAIAQLRNSTVATIRNYIKIILQKTATSKQQELVSLLLRSPLSFKKSLANTAHLNGQDYLLTLSDQRQLSYRVYGDTNLTPLVLCHASLSCRLEAPLHMEELLSQGFYLIVPERAGFGLSSLPAYNSLIDFAHDLEQLLDHLKIESSYLLGTLAGGCFALAMAHSYPERVKELLLIESFSPLVEPHQVAGAPFFYRHFPRLCQAWPRVALYSMRLSMFEFKRKPNESYRHLLGLFNERDASTLARTDIKTQATLQAIESTRQGVEALLQDIVLTTQEWGFDVSGIKCKCHIFYGEGDPVAAAFAHKLQTLLPNQVAHFHKNQGFASLLYLQLPNIIKSLDWTAGAHRPAALEESITV